MKYLAFIVQLIVLLTYSSCMEKKVYDVNICDDLSMKFYRGLPKPSKEYKDECSGFKLNYTQEKCKQALQHLMLGTSEIDLKKKHGDKIMGCFNNSDLERFLKN